MMTKVDLYKEHKAEYAAKQTPSFVDVSKAKYLTVEGEGDPNGPDFQAKIAALYGMAYTLKFTSKAAGRDYAVCKLEGLWWATDGAFEVTRTDNLAGKFIIRTPDFITAKDLAPARAALEQKGKGECAGDVKLETLKEGRCAQILHVGPYAAEGPTIERLLAFVEDQGLRLDGLHHEIYLGDPRRTAPEKLKTILRYPVKRATQ